MTFLISPLAKRNKAFLPSSVTDKLKNNGQLVTLRWGKPEVGLKLKHCGWLGKLKDGFFFLDLLFTFNNMIKSWSNLTII